MKTRRNIRIVAVSATIPNIEEVSQWIGQPGSKGGSIPTIEDSYLAVSACNLVFGEEYRPVKLERYCYGYPQLENESDFQFESKLNKVYGPYSKCVRSLISGLWTLSNNTRIQNQLSFFVPPESKPYKQLKRLPTKSILRKKRTSPSRWRIIDHPWHN